LVIEFVELAPPPYEGGGWVEVGIPRQPSPYPSLYKGGEKPTMTNG